jgi:hypothetical protein
LKRTKKKEKKERKIREICAKKLVNEYFLKKIKLALEKEKKKNRGILKKKKPFKVRKKNILLK